MDYLVQPSLSEIFLYGNVGQNAFIRIIDSINRVFNSFYKKPPLCSENADWLYSKKTIKRKFL